MANVMMLTMESITTDQISRRMMYVTTVPPAPGAGPYEPAPLPRSRVARIYRMCRVVT
ncbi:hypothetical protein GCM10023193_76420 [Planotetraspora kaengkrachanensis]|uniref:Uncharacterized protein n=1 Tax=Planotetraspora kaengkrachanensis TaxID=575193 RepID=A0A8J3Q002_9ACTN|nr:hypothetical protein Pka01_74760 [Planotetraspora kaengkrachanensis]